MSSILTFKHTSRLVCFLAMIAVVEGYQKLPNGNGCSGQADHPCTRTGLLREVDDYLTGDEQTVAEVVRVYGPFEEWDTSDVTNMALVFLNHNFNGDISRWNVAKVSNKISSK